MPTSASDLPPFDPQWLAVEQAMGGRQALSAQPIDEARAGFDGIIAMLQPMLPPKTDAVRTKDIQVPRIKSGSGSVEVRVYIPTYAEGETLPLGLYIHSGGWYSGSIDAEDHLCRQIVTGAPIILFSPNYRLAPENPYPAGLDDCCAVYEYMHDHASEFGGNSSKKVVMGGSAAGNLSVCVALKYVTDNAKKPTGLISACLLSCEPNVMPEEYKTRYTPELYADSPMISNEIAARAREWYQAPPKDVLYSPLLHPDIKLLPRTYITACTKDPTHQETVFFYEECKKQGVDAELVEWVGWPHFFWIIPVIPKSSEFMSVWIDQLRRMI